MRNTREGILLSIKVHEDNINFLLFEIKQYRKEKLLEISKIREYIEYLRKLAKHED